MYVVIEGSDGAGKTTVAAALRDAFSADRTVVMLRDQPDTVVGRTARQYFIDGGHGQGVDQYVAALLMVASRIDLHRSIDWSDGVLRICDRSFVTTYAYQRAVEERVLDGLHGFDRHVPHVHLPDLVLYLRVTPDVAIYRARVRGQEHVMDDEICALCAKYDELFLVACGKDPLEHPDDDRQTWARTRELHGRAVVVDANGPLEGVVAACVSEVRSALQKKRS